MIATCAPQATLEPTTIATAAATRWQAVVVGAGPAGTAAAIRLARRGVRVLLIERGGARRGKVCGCCLSPLAIAELADLDPGCGASGPAAVSWQPLDRIRLSAGGRSAVFGVSPGAVLSREALDLRLVQVAAAAGCDWLPHTAVTGVADDAAGVTLALCDAAGGRSRVTADACILATGLGGTVRLADATDSSDRLRGLRTGRAATRTVAARSRLGCGTTLAAGAGDLPPGELTMCVGRSGYCGLVRLEDGRIDVAAAVDPALVAAVGPAAAVALILRDACGGAALPTCASELARAAYRGTPLLTGRRPLVAGTSGRVFMVGDAAGYVEPFTGEGIGWALAAGRLAAEALAAEAGIECRWPPRAAMRYETAHRATFAGSMARCRVVAAAVRWPALVAACAGVARTCPSVASRLAPLVTGGLGPGAAR